MAKSTPIFRQKKIDRTVAIDSTGASQYTQYRPFAYFEPKLKNRFVLYLDVHGIYIPSYLVKSATKPGFTYDNIELQYINTKTNFKGKSNEDLWREYLEVSKNHNIKAIWVKGHNGDIMNERCNKIAQDLVKGNK